jgi:DNA-binding CsgD family transcriptional regulator/tetratricopeptide (TPR) repeat protein
VTALVDQSLLGTVSGGDDEPRFVMLETIREFGREQLAASGEEARVRDAHAAWFVRFAERVEPELTGPNQAAFVDRLEAEIGNIRAALDWLRERGEAEDALRLAGALGWWWCSPGHFHEGQERFAALAAMPEAAAAPAALAKVVSIAGAIANWLDDQVRAQALYEQALALYRDLGDRANVAGMLRGLGSIALDLDQPEQARSPLEEGLGIARESGNTWDTAACVNLLGTVAFALGDYSTAVARHQDAVAIWRRLGDTGHVVVALECAGWAALVGGDAPAALAAFAEALALNPADDPWYCAAVLDGSAGLAARGGDTKRAAVLFGASAVLREEVGVPLRPARQRALDRMVADVRAALGETDFAAARETGRVLSATDAIAFARDALHQPSPTTTSTSAADAGAPHPVAPARLTRREREVLRFLVDGRSDREIADALFVTRSTVSKHVMAILAKLDVSSRTAAATVAVRRHLI